MAQHTTVRLVDDLDGSDATDTVEFGLDGKYFEIDLSEENAQRLRDALQAFIAAARQVRISKPGRGPKRGAVAGGSTATTADREQNQAMRRWAREHDIEVNERGRIPQRVQDAYHANDPSLALRDSADDDTEDETSDGMDEFVDTDENAEDLNPEFASA